VAAAKPPLGRATKGQVRKRSKRSRVIRRVAIAGAPDRAAAEALYLELRRLAERRGIAVSPLRIAPTGSRRPPS
jgi:hypothetical protein